ncbi:MAG TPA: hypothetical protein VH082_11935 [Rudaea sp.]|jgi:uncharacterized delta-60 repeat protein|nr:hypothetical protein [Rudaea sp.]
MQLTLAAILLAGATAHAGAPQDSGALDATFGTAGKMRLANPPGNDSFVATDAAIQPDGKTVIAGYTDYQGTPDGWVVTRLNADGSLDTNFGGHTNGNPVAGFEFPYAGSSVNQAFSVALRPDGHIVVGGTIIDENNGRITAVVLQLNADGSADGSFGNNGPGATYLTPASGDSSYLARLIIDSDGTTDVAGTYYNNQGGFNGNQFYFARVSTDGKTIEPFQYEFGSGPNQDDHALNLAIDNQGRYVLVGYHRGSGGNYDCAAIRILNNLFDVDNTFGTAGQTTVAFDLGGDDGDSCDAIAIFHGSQYMAIGGHASVDASGNQKAIIAMLDNNGDLDQYYSDQIGYPARLAFTYGGAADAATTVSKLIIDNNDTKTPTLMAIGTGFQSSVPYGDAFGVARFTLPAYVNFAPDTTFNGSGTQSVFFDECPDGIGLLRTYNAAGSATYANGKLTVVGETACTSGGTSNISAARFAPFDVIFNNGLDFPSY